MAFTISNAFENQHGQALVEYLYALPILLLLILGSIQFALAFIAKTTLNEATFYAARSGSLNHANFLSMQTALAHGLSPLYQNSQESHPIMVLNSQTKALSAVLNTSDVCIQILNPSKSAFSQFGVFESLDYGEPVFEIPNARLLYKPTSATDGESIQDANILKIRVHYCYQMIVPFIGTLISSLASSGIINVTSPWQVSCYQNNGIPLVSNANVLMQSSAYRGLSFHSKCQ